MGDSSWTSGLYPTATTKQKKTKRNRVGDRTPLLSHSPTNGQSHAKMGYSSFTPHAHAHKESTASSAPNKETKLPSIISTLTAMFGWQLLGATLVKLCSDLLSFANPLLLSELIAFVENPAAAMWYGYAVALTLFVASELRSVFLNNYYIVMA